MTLEEGAAEVKYYRDANEKLGMLIPSSSDYVQMVAEPEDARSRKAKRLHWVNHLSETA